MEKLGVVVDGEKVASAKVTKMCPLCGCELGDTNPPKCEDCGTKPFESDMAGVTTGRTHADRPNLSNPPRTDDYFPEED